MTRLIAMGQAYVAFARANPAIYLLMFRHAQAFSKSAHLQTASHAAWDQLETAVTRGDRAGTRRCASAALRMSGRWCMASPASIIDRRLPMPLDPAVVIAQSLSSLPAAIRGLGQA